MKYDKYIGLPYKDNGRDTSGIDCWGLVRLYYKQELNIDLPSYTEEYDGPYDSNVTRAISIYKDKWEQTATPSEGDVVLFNIYGEPAHVGVYLGDKKFLHCRENQDSVVESLDNFKWSKRLAGTYKYSEQPDVQVVGIPHPLKNGVYREWTVAGTTIQNFVDFAKQKYSISEKVASKIVIAVDGVPVPQELWTTTKVTEGQTIAYRAIAGGGGGNPFRTLLTLAVVVAAVYFAGPAGFNFAAGSWQAAAATMAMSMAGMALVNSIFPIRPPEIANPNDPGTAGGLNLFTGTSNQANKFGPIPVVLGRVRMTGVLGAQPYIESLADTTVLNSVLVWGFGPLSVSDICVGANPITNYYDGLPMDIPRPVTLSGDPNEDQTAFNSLYGSDAEQQFKKVELVNNPSDGNPWQYVYFNQESTAVDVAFSCPEGMRKVNIRDGTDSATKASVEVQLGAYNINTNSWTFGDTPAYSLQQSASYSPNATNFIDVIYPVPDINLYAGTTGYFNLYRYSVYAMVPGGGIQRFDGAASEYQNSSPSNALKQLYASGSYSNLVGINTDYSLIPQLPPSYKRLYTICVRGRSGVVSTQSHITEIGTAIGLGLTTTALVSDIVSDTGVVTSATSGAVKITIAPGTVYNSTDSSSVPANVTPTEIFNSRSFTGITATQSPTNQNSGIWNIFFEWCDFLKTYAIWGSDPNSNLDITKTVTFPKDGYYAIEASADDQGAVYIDGRKVLTMSQPASTSTVKVTQYFDAGSHTVKLTATSGNDIHGAALKITYTAAGLNTLASTHTEIVFGVDGFYSNRKDAFNFTQHFRQLPKNRYAVRVRRTNSSVTDDETDYRKYFRVTLYNAVCFNNTLPIKNPPNCYLAKTAVRVQSSNKINGNVDGINAMVQTVCWDWDSTYLQWVVRPTNNPASLFLHVLMHPANAYKLSLTEATQKVDLQALADWSVFCDTTNPSGTRLTYNNIITGNISVMDVLKDICAAGMASPSYVNGKWTVVIDRVRAYTTQHFTTHNSSKFESTKTLPRLPHAFRISIADEQQAFQTVETIVYNYGYNADGSLGKTMATLFETINLPGVTNLNQAKFLAKWHLAQLSLRPETYTLNTDFEYLVCTRGDVVKVTHDVPQWGTGSGRLKSATVGANTLDLTEPMYLTAGKTYRILVRTNDKTNPNGITKTLNTITTTGWYTTINLTTSISINDGLEIDNLFMLGELNKETQQLVVLSIEPNGETGAKLTLVDYAPSIYTADLTQLQTFDSAISTNSSPIVLNTITQPPTIVDVTSDSVISQAISSGTYQNVVIISFANPIELTNNAQKIQVQLVPSDADFSSLSLDSVYEINKENTSLTVTGLTTGGMYKFRARYLNQMGSITGPWSEIYYFTNSGKDTNSFYITSLTMDMDGTEIIAYPPNVNKPSDFKYYEYRIYKDTGSTDFWDLDLTLNNIKAMTSTNEGRFDLRDQAKPRISANGITYRVAARAVDNNGNYSSVSALASIVVKTIQ